jgi:hypothetical protein
MSGSSPIVLGGGSSQSDRGEDVDADDSDWDDEGGDSAGAKGKPKSKTTETTFAKAPPASLEAVLEDPSLGRHAVRDGEREDDALCGVW